MTWKLISIESPGNADSFGGNDINKINKYLSGYDLKVVDTSDVVDIATQTTFESEKFRILSPTTGFAYIFKSADIAADRTINLPLMTGDGTISLSATGATNDWGNFMQTFRHQYIKFMNPANTYGYIWNTSGIAANRSITLPALASDDTVVFASATQTLYNKTLTSPTISAMTINTDANTIKHSSTNNNGDIMVNNGTKFDRFARGGANQVPIMDGSGTGLTWIDKSSLQGTPGTSGDYQVPTVGNVIAGAWYGTTEAGGSGCWSDNLTEISNITPVPVTDTSGRIGMRYNFTADEDRAGFKTTSAYFTRDNDPELWVRYKAVSGVSDPDYRITIGFLSDVDADLGTGDDTLANLKCFTWYKEIQDTTSINIGYNDGDTTGNKDSSVTLSSSDTNIHTIKVFGDSGNSRFGISLDGGNASYINTEIPVAGERLGCVVHFENEDTNSRSFEVYGAYFKCKVL